MELIGNHLKVFVTPMVVLGASVVARICDLPKKNNEHLREVNVELRVRREEEQRRPQMLMHTAPASAVNAAARRRPVPRSAVAQKGSLTVFPPLLGSTAR